MIVLGRLVCHSNANGEITSPSLISLSLLVSITPLSFYPSYLSILPCLSSLHQQGEQQLACCLCVCVSLSLCCLHQQGERQQHVWQGWPSLISSPTHTHMHMVNVYSTLTLSLLFCCTLSQDLLYLSFFDLSVRCLLFFLLLLFLLLHKTCVCTLRGQDTRYSMQQIAKRVEE